MKTKKLLISLLVFCIIIFTGCTSTLEKKDNKKDNAKRTIRETILNATFLHPADNELFYYNVYDSFVEITGFINDYEKNVKIPDTIEGKPVYLIGPGTFANSSIETVEITKNVYSIKAEAFAKCENLKSVTFTDVTDVPKGTIKGEGLINLRERAFYACVSLESITLPETLKTVEDSVFEGCISLTKIIIPPLITSIPDEFCADCESLAEIHFGDAVEKIDSSSFRDISPDAKMYGRSQSAAARYASDNFIYFIVIKD